jgi:hypothetical protein
MIFLVGSSDTEFFSIELEEDDDVSLLRDGADDLLRPVTLNLVLNALFVAVGGRGPYGVVRGGETDDGFINLL